jgi:hypothetical protein
MARQHYIVPQGSMPTALTVRLGAGNTTGDNFDEKEVGKFVKLTAESRYDLCAAGDEIEAVITSVELATQGGYSIGGVVDEGIMYVTADGLQATPGTGTIALGDYVLTGSVTAKGTALPSYAKVVKATTQANAKATPYAWRVVSLGTAGTGAVGTTIVVKKVA